MSDQAISVENVSKSYLLGHRQVNGHGYTALRDVIARGAGKLFRDAGQLLRGRPIVRGDHVNEFWALQDISFRVALGDRVGIIGRNGAGKSTLLKILSRITEPTTGRITVAGRVASLLEVGTGFHPELTGRENIYLNGTLLGMQRREITRKFDDIVEFADVRRFLDTPVKRYSSGMYVRLAFAVAAHLDPDILIVDEVLAVGDNAFQAKCLDKMDRVAREGRTVLFVSHNLAAIRTLCNSGILLDAGRITAAGPVQRIVDTYLSTGAERSCTPLTHRADRCGDGRLRFTRVSFLNSAGDPIEEVTGGDPLTISIDYVCEHELDPSRMIVAISLFDQLRSPVCLFASDEMGVRFGPFSDHGSLRVAIPRLPLRGGTYTLTLQASCLSTAPENFCDRIEDAATLHVLPGDWWKTGCTNRSGSYSVIDAVFSND